jgi:hypothetical protein
MLTLIQLIISLIVVVMILLFVCFMIHTISVCILFVLQERSVLSYVCSTLLVSTTVMFLAVLITNISHVMRENIPISNSVSVYRYSLIHIPHIIMNIIFVVIFINILLDDVLVYSAILSFWANLTIIGKIIICTTIFTYLTMNLVFFHLSTNWINRCNGKGSFCASVCAF